MVFTVTLKKYQDKGITYFTINYFFLLFFVSFCDQFRKIYLSVTCQIYFIKFKIHL